MPISTPSVNLPYKKYRDPLSQEVTMSPLYELFLGGVTVHNVPNWLRVAMKSVNTQTTPDSYVYTLTPIATYANNLPVGTHSATIEFRYKVGPTPGVSVTVKEPLTVSISVSDTVALTVQPSFISQSYTIGQPAPGKKFLSIASENNWTIIKDQSWVTLNKTQGTGNASVEIGFDPAGLASGSHTAQLLIDDGYDKKTVVITLNVLGENTSSDFLIVAPDSFEWVESFEAPSTKTKKITVESSEDFTINSNVPWITFSSNNWTAGQRSIQAVATDTDTLAYGVHQGVITVASTYSSKTIQVLLTINQVVLNGLESGTLYFADDRNKISFANTVDNSELLLQHLTDNGAKQFNYIKTSAFYRGVGESILGTEAKNIINPFYELDNLNSRCFVPVLPLNMTINVYDKIVNSSQQTLRGTFDNVKVLTGSTPVKPNWLSYIPETISTTKDAIIVFSFIADTPPTEIKITGAVDTTFNVTALTGGIYTCMVNLSEFTLVPGNVVNIFCAGNLVKVNIDPVEPEHTKLAWLNEWSCPEMFTCKGDLQILNEAEQTLAKYAHEGKERSKVLEVTRPQVYKVNTGFIYTREEVAWLQRILDAKQIWIEIQGEFIEVNRTFSSLPFYETRNFLDAYELTFEKAVV